MRIMSERSDIESVPVKASMIDILLDYNSFEYWRWKCFSFAFCLLWQTLPLSQTLLVLLVAITDASPAQALPLCHAHHAIPIMFSQIIAAFLVRITAFHVLKPLVFAKVAQANFTFLSPPGLVNPVPLALKSVHFQQSSNASLDTT